MSQYFRATIAQAASCRACHSCGDRFSLLLLMTAFLPLAARDARGLSKKLQEPLQKRREAERRKTHPTTDRAPTFILQPLAGEDKGGGAARVRRDALASRRSTAALARGFTPGWLNSRPCFLGLGSGGRYPPSPVPVQGKHLRTGRSTGVNDARSSPGTGRNPARGNRPRSTFESTLAKGPSVNEMVMAL